MREAPVAYEDFRKDLVIITANLSQVLRPESANKLSAIVKKLKEETFNLVVLGQFKRGKSTFINALLGNDVLPTAIVPLTSVVTILKYGAIPEAKVCFFNGNFLKTDLTALPLYITERENPENTKGVEKVEVSYPSEYLRNGVQIIDTPGVGSVYSHNTEAALACLPQVDAGIFVVSADPPISSNEHEFLKEIRAYASKLFFVLNKIDQVNEKEQQESLEFTKSILERDLGTGNVRIYPLSARMALTARKNNNEEELKQSRLPDFEKQLKAFLIHEKGQILLASAVASILRLVTNEIFDLNLEIKAAEFPLEELKAKISLFEKEADIIQKDREQNSFLLEGYIKNLIAGLDEDLRVFLKEKKGKLIEAVDREYSRLVQQGTKNLREDLEQFLFEKVRSMVSAWRKQLTEKISAQLEEIHLNFAKKTNESIERICALAENMFDLRLKPFTYLEKLTQKSNFYFLLKSDPVSLEMIQTAFTSALPRFMAKRIILKSTKTYAGELLDRHCGRIRHDLVSRVNITVQEFRQALDEKIAEAFEGIRNSLQNALVLCRGSEEEAERNRAIISKKLSILSEISDKLKTYMNTIEKDLSV